MNNLLNILTAVLFSTNISSAQNSTTSLPASITFERIVVQQQNGQDGKATNTYHFTISGDYAMAKREEEGDDDKATILYTKDGKMCMINEKEKIITIMNMPRMIGDAGAAIKKGMDKKPMPKDDEDKMTVTKTGKTKMICGYTAYEYEITNEGGKSGWWYALVDFNPVKIYTMGAGSTGIAEKMKGKEVQLKNNPMAIPVLNKNYLWAEIDVAGKKGMETKSISKEVFTFSTAGYTIKEMKGFKTSGD